MRRFVVGLAMGIATFAPSWAFADDEQIAKAIVEKLEARKKDGQLKGFNIDLKVDKGTVWMTGHVTSTEQQQLALDVARRAEGVEAVVNDLKVKRNASTAKTGEAQKAVASETAQRPSLLGRWLGSSGVAANDGASASRTNKLDAQVKPAAHENENTPTKAIAPKTPVNEALIEVLAERLSQHKDAGLLKDFDINLTADQGNVTVAGEACSAEQRDLILDTIRRTPGVTQVVNMLDVSGQAGTSEPTPIRARQVIEPATPTFADLDSAPQALPVGSAVSPRQSRTGIATALDSRDDSARGTGVAQVAAPPTAPIPMPVPETSVAPASRQAGVSVGGYTAIPVQVMPAPFSPGHVSPLQPNSPHLAQRPLAFAPATGGAAMASNMQPVASMPAHMPGPGIGIAPARFDHPNMPGYAWPSYAAHPNYAAVTYPKQYSPSAWPYIGPFYPYPQVPLGWRKVTMQWDDGWWYLDFKDK